MTRTGTFVILACSTALACGGGKGSSSPSTGQLGSASPISDQAYVLLADAPDGLDLQLSDGTQGAPAYDRAKLAPAKKLAAADTQALLARAAPITTDPADQQAFALRPGSQPAPRTGTVITASFPPPASSLLPPPPASSEAGKDLRVLRYMPEGPVPLAPELSVTFSQPMIAVTSQTDAAATVPVKLTPQPPGSWRWIGTRTILFDPKVRFPQATTYKVEIPAGTQSALKGALKTATTFTFETPAPKLLASYPPPNRPQHLDPPMFVLFDQKIDPAAVLAKLVVTAAGTPVAVKQLDTAALEALAKSKRADDRQVASLVEAARKNEQDGRWIAFRAAQSFPSDAAIVVEVPKGTPSAEGPNTTPELQRFDFRTYPKLALEKAHCGHGGPCVPGQAFYLDFTNPIDEETFDEAWVTVTPAVPQLKVLVSDDHLVLAGLTDARTTYSIAIASKLTDEFGQTLGKDETATWTVGDARPTFYGPSGMVVLDPAAKKPTLDFFSTNYEQLKVRLYRVSPTDYDAYGYYLRNLWNKDRPPPLPGTLVFDQLVKTTQGANKLVETSVDLMPALNRSGLGHAIAIVEPSPWTQPWDPPRLISWVQSTRLGIDTSVDAQKLVAFATELDTGKPAAGVALEMVPAGLRAQTDDKGNATIQLPELRGAKGAHFLIARRGDDVAFITEGDYWSDMGSWLRQDRPVTLTWYVTDDRKMYRPGEEVSLKGWLRTIDAALNGDVGGPDGVTGVKYTVHDARSVKLAEGTAPVSAAGGFDLKLTLPKTPNLGTARITFEAQGRTGRGNAHYHTFQVEEFRRPEFEVSTQPSDGPFLVAGSGELTVSAKYYTGAPLPGADVNWVLNASQTTFTPPNRDGYVFGAWRPWWDASPRPSVRRAPARPIGRGGRRPVQAAPDEGQRTWSHRAKTDGAGAHVLHVDLKTVKPAQPMRLTASAMVSDVNRQVWTSSTSVVVHPSQLYVGLKPKKPFVEKGTPFDVDVIGVDLDGKAAIDAKIEVVAVRLDWEYKRGEYTQTEVDPTTCTVVAAKDAKPCSFPTKVGGQYQITATIADAKGRPNQTRMTFWVAGGELPKAREVEQEKVQLVPDRKEYAPGQAAELLVQAPFYPAEAVVSWRRSGIVKTERVQITGPTKVITVPITDAMVPNLYVQVDLVGMAPRLDDKGDVDPKLPKRPAYATGQIDLPVPPKQRTLEVEVAPNVPKLGPGETAQLAVTVKDAQGRPVAGAETAVIVVDEAILALTGHQFASPIETFYRHRAPDVRDRYLRGHVKLAKPSPDVVTSAPMVTGGGTGAGMGGGGGGPTRNGSTVRRKPMSMPRPAAAPGRGAVAGAADESGALGDLTKKEKGAKTYAFSDIQVDGMDDKDAGGAGGGGGGNKPIALRSNFNPLAAFAPVVKTDGAGRARVTVKVPDNLTRYRIVAIATSGDKQFGKGESALTARLPLMVRPSPPRFLNFGDTFELPVVVQNQTDAPMTVRLAARTANAALTDGAGREVMVPANDRVEVRFPAAAELAGTARFQLVGAAGTAAGGASPGAPGRASATPAEYNDSAEVALPVWTPATTEAFATYGVIDDGAMRQPVALPGKVVTQFGGLEVTTASTNLQALTDALLYLVQYPYECAEQRASRVLAIAALRDVLTAFKTKDLPTPAAMEISIRTDVERLSQLQNYDGGFAYWERGRPSEPYLTVYVTNALARAQKKGFPVLQHVLDRAKQYLVTIEQRYPHWYSPEVRNAISAYALYTRKQLGDLDVAKGKKLLADAGGVTKVTMETNGWLLGLFAGNPAAAAERQAIVRHALNKVSETAGAANFTTSYGDGAYTLLASDRRVDAVMLESLIQEQKGLDLIPKVVTGLLGHRKAGRWLNTQENTFALLAMDLYFQTYEKATPDFVARVWLGNDYAGDHAFKGRSTDYFAIPIPMKDVAAHDKQDLTIQKDGRDGRLYYRIGMKYAPASLQLEPADYGFVVERRYEGADDPKDVVRQPDGTWKIKAGARVRVKLTMVNENRRYHVALVDPLPAGLEPMNPRLAVTGPIPQDPGQSRGQNRYWWWYGPWYEHQNLRDERVEAFASLLWQGVHTYEYVARATTPGRYVVPPSKAEEMYMPETFGRSASDRVIIE